MRRREDPGLITGRGRYVDDVPAPGCLHAAFARSPLAHARITGIETAAAASVPGVVAVYTAADLGLRPRQAFGLLPEEVGRPPLAHAVVRFVGDAVAVVVAESRAAAADGAALVEIAYDSQPVLATPEAAAREGAPVLFPEHGSNLAYESASGNAEAGDPLAGAEVVIRQRMTNQRVAAVPMEGNAILAVPGDGRLTVYVSTQSPFQVRDAIADALGLPEDGVRCVAPNVGGGFGAKIAVYAEHVVVAAAAHRLGRPLKWVETRSEGMVAMDQGRGQVQDVELGARRDGTLVGLRVRVVADGGAYPAQGAFLPTLTGQLTSGCYRIPGIDFRSRSYATNTTPMSAYRGAGRPEATALVERAMDILAAELGLDPVALRRRNLLRAGEFPYVTATQAEYDSGDYERALDLALEMAGYETLRGEQRRRRESGEGPLIGIGICCYVEVTALGSPTEFGRVDVDGDGRVTIRVGTADHGQGHGTAYSALVAGRLGIQPEQVTVVEGDTDGVPRGDGTQASRSLQLGGSALAEACDLLLDRAREVGGRLLEVGGDDLELGAGRLQVRGVPARSVTWAELAAAEPGLGAEADFVGMPTYPFGCHLAVVEVDAETGHVRLRRHIAVDDCGTLLHPVLAEGQIHGGIAQGAAQALWEEVVYDAEGNPRTASLLDYGIPTANELPEFETAFTQTPSPNNPLGAKGVGESGTIGATPAVWNAVVDALSHLGIRHLDMPLTPDRVWAAIQAAPAGLPPKR